MRKQFKKGDWVRCIDDSVCGALITKGNPYKVMEDQTDNFVSIMDEGESIVTLFAARFELAEQPTTEDLSKIKFKKGDKLMCIESSSLRSITKGKIYTALSDESEFMQHIKVMCDYGTVQEYPRTKFELYKAAEEQPTTENLKQTTMERKFKKGDLVECIDNSWHVELLTNEKIYEVSDSNGDIIYVSCDDGLNRFFNQSHFKLHKAAEGLYETTEQVDMVNNPPHYNQGSVECIEAIKAALTEEEFRGYCKGNAIKYIWREKHKGGKESIEKANWYLNKL